MTSKVTTKQASDLQSKRKCSITSKQAKINGMMDAIMYKKKEELVSDCVASVIDRLLHGEDNKAKSGRGDITTLIRLDRTIMRPEVSARSAFKRAWPLFLRDVCGSFLELDNELRPTGQNTEGAIAEAAIKDEETQAPRKVAYYRQQFDLIVAEIKAQDKAERKPPKTDEEKFIALAEKLGVDVDKLKAMIPQEVEEEIAA